MKVSMLQKIKPHHQLGTCDNYESKSAVIQEIANSKRLPLTGPATGNKAYTATSEPFGRSKPLVAGDTVVDVMYGSGQYALQQNKTHCERQANDFTKADFNLAWDYLACELNRFFSNDAAKAAFDSMILGIEPIVTTAATPPSYLPNPWIGATSEDFVEFFKTYFFQLPTPSGKYDGLSLILKANYLNRGNPAAFHFFNTFKSQTPPATSATTEFYQWTYKWLTARGMWMDSPGSAEVVKVWVDYINEPDNAKKCQCGRGCL